MLLCQICKQIWKHTHTFILKALVCMQQQQKQSAWCWIYLLHYNGKLPLLTNFIYQQICFIENRSELFIKEKERNYLYLLSFHLLIWDKLIYQHWIILIYSLNFHLWFYLIRKEREKCYLHYGILHPKPSPSKQLQITPHQPEQNKRLWYIC